MANDLLRDSPFVKGQVDFSSWFWCLYDRFLFTIAGAIYVLLFEGWRMLVFVALLVLLDVVRWRNSPVYSFTRDELADSVIDKQMRERLIARWRRHPMTSCWLLFVPVVVPLGFSFLLIAYRDSPETLIAISSFVEPILAIFNGEAIRYDLRHIGEHASYGSAALVANLLWALGAFVLSFLVLFRGGTLPANIAEILKLPDHGNKEIYRILKSMKKRTKKINFLSALFFSFGIFIGSIFLIKNTPAEANIFNFSFYLIYTTMSLLTVVGLSSTILYLLNSYRYLFAIESKNKDYLANLEASVPQDTFWTPDE